MVQIELENAEEVLPELKRFISHMVQIEPGGLVRPTQMPSHFISHMVQIEPTGLSIPAIPNNPLYPTWFRLNGGQICLRRGRYFLYIPHGSD